MNPLVKKEIRLLLPAWIAAMLLAIVPAWATGIVCAANSPPSVWMSQSWLSFYLPLIIILGVLFLGVASFGQEISSGTFAILLSQPLERRRIWRMKTITLSIAFASVWLAAVISVWCQFYIFNHSNNAPNLPSGQAVNFFSNNTNTFEFLTLSALMAFSGGLWTTLLLRQITGAFWVTVLTPMAIIIGIGLLPVFSSVSDHSVYVITSYFLLFYSIAGFLWARRLFLRAQDTQWTGGEISFQWRRKISKSQTASVSSQPRQWFSALVRKEIQLHQASLLIAALVLVLHLSSAFIRKIHPHFENQGAEFALEAIWVFWLFMPLLIGAAATAEERRFGILESQLCQPVSRRVQFVVKFSIALALSLLLGAAVPLLIEGTHIFDYWIFAAAAVIFFFSFCASSLARTIPQAVGVAIILSALIILYAIATASGILRLGTDSQHSRLGLELLNLYLGLPILIVVAGWLAFWNFKWLHENRKVWRRNITAILAAFAAIFILTNAIYFRSWEFLMPSEPRGAPCLSTSTAIQSAHGLNTLYITQPDGRLWSETFAFNEITNRWWRSDVLVPNRSHAQFIAGSNWATVAADNFQALGIQSDGTLWSIQREWNPARSRWEQTGPFALTKIGLDADWRQAAGDAMGFLLLKKDGSLWTWGTHDYNSRNRNSIPKKLKSDLAALPVRAGGQASWTELFSTDSRAYAKKPDGNIWRWIAWGDTNYVSRFIQETNLDDRWSNFAFPRSEELVGVTTNGELWFDQTIGSAALRQKTRLVKIQLGEGEKWKMASRGTFDGILAIRDDGTLWKWPTFWALKPVQLGNHSDWVTLEDDWMGEFALASDGSLWAWNQPSKHVWLAPSRRPLYLGNIFQGSTAQN